MANDTDSILTNPPTQDVATHVRDYTRFTKLFLWSAILSFIVGFIVVIIISS